LEHTIFCWSCSTPFNAIEATWCGCSLGHPTKICPFCYTCACQAPEDYLSQFWRDLPEQMRQELSTLGQPRKKIGELLVERGRITDQQLGELLERQRNSGVRLGDILVDLGMASRDEVSRHLAEQQEMEVVELDPKDLSLSLVVAVGAKLCLQHGFVPLDRQEFAHLKILIVAVAEPLRAAELDRLGEQLGCKLYQKFAPPEQIRLALDRIRKIAALARKPGAT
jgi:hypothetical protein